MKLKSKATYAVALTTGITIVIFIAKKRREEMKPKTKSAVEALKRVADAAKETVTLIPEPNDSVIFTPRTATIICTPEGERPVNIKPTSQMKDNEKKELIQRIRAMSNEELEILAENIPVELCLKRIELELDKAKQFEKSIKSAMNGLND